MAHYYHEPEPFRYRLGAFIQAARNVTFMLQNEKMAFEDFSWYEAWAERASVARMCSLHPRLFWSGFLNEPRTCRSGPRYRFLLARRPPPGPLLS